MPETKRIANQLERSQKGSAWHGPALGELLADVDAELARRRPLPGAHNIWELVLHITAWQAAAIGAVNGKPMPNLTDVEDWPSISHTDEDWREAVRHLGRVNQELVASVNQFPDARLRERVPDREFTFYFLLHGVVQHNLYHAGQVALLKKSAKL